MTYLAIDPGSSNNCIVAWEIENQFSFEPNVETIDFGSTVQSRNDGADHLAAILSTVDPDFIILEEAIPASGNSAMATFHFAAAFGRIEACVANTRAALTVVKPQSWIPKFGAVGKSRNGLHVYDKLILSTPMMLVSGKPKKVTKKAADAIAMLQMAMFPHKF